MNTNSISNHKRQWNDTLLLLLLGLFSFGGANGRFLFGLAVFDILLLAIFFIAIFNRKDAFYTIHWVDLAVITVFLSFIFYGFLRRYYLPGNVSYDFFITELRFFMYLPLIYYISVNLIFDINIFEKVLPYLLVFYIILWGVFITEGSALYNFFNDGGTTSIGEQERISGPSVLILVPLMMILIRQKSLSFITLILYNILILIVFIKTGGRTYFVFFLFPVFYLMYKKRGNLNLVFLAFIMIIGAIFTLKFTTEAAFFERFTKVTNVTQDGAFMYRVSNIIEMISRFDFPSFLFGNGIGSNYDVIIWFLHKSYFLDNSFMTLIYKIGITGLIIFLMIFFINKKCFPNDLYLFEIASLFLIAMMSYHIILNPVFLFGYFIILNYYRRSIRANQYLASN